MSTAHSRGFLGGAWRSTGHPHPHVYGSSRATGRAPHVRRGVDLLGLQETLLVALLPCAAAGVVVTGHHVAASGGESTGWRAAILDVVGLAPAADNTVSCAALGLLYLVPTLAAAAAAAYACAFLFAHFRGRHLDPGTAGSVLVFTLLLPAGVPPWQAALGMAIGIVLGREVFGGPGRTCVHPAVVGLLILQLSYPDGFRAGAAGVIAGHVADGGLALAATGGREALEAAGLTWWDTVAGLDPGGLGDTSVVACALGAFLLLIRRAASPRVTAGAVLGVVVAALLLDDGPFFRDVPWTWHLTTGSLAFVLVFVVTDPASGAFTNSGRWLHGALVGFLAVTIRVASPAHVEGALLAALLGSVLVPLIDHAVVRAHVLRRRRRG